MWTAVLSAIGGIASDWFKNKRQEAQTKHKVKLEQIKAQKDWDNIQAQNSSTSWKDEWFTIIFSIPLLAAFIPPALPYVQEGFVALEAMPDFYKAFLGAAVAASFGMKSIARWKQ